VSIVGGKGSTRPSATKLFEQDHREVEKLFARFKESNDRSVATRICEEPDLHTEVEAEIVYPVLRAGVTNGNQMADEAEQEHAEAKQLIGRIERTDDQGHLGALVAELERRSSITSPRRSVTCSRR
jgi:iron-sulfur cluster repair protein YtfE (RIC family)